MIGHWQALVIDCPEPQRLASFYQELLGLTRLDDEPGWVTLGGDPDPQGRSGRPGRPDLAFQRVSDYQPPRWPEAAAPQHMHLDVAVTDLAKAQAKVLALGGKALPGGGVTFRVFADPAGHPFCLVLADKT